MELSDSDEDPEREISIPTVTTLKVLTDRFQDLILKLEKENEQLRMRIAELEMIIKDREINRP